MSFHDTILFAACLLPAALLGLMACIHHDMENHA
jgi:hypothetical protein